MKTNKETTKDKLIRFIEKQKPDYCINFIVKCIRHAAEIRPKEREAIFFLLTSVFKYFNIDFNIAKKYSILEAMLIEKNVIPCVGKTIKRVFGFSDEKTIGRAIFEDNIDMLQTLLATPTDTGYEKSFFITNYIMSNRSFDRYTVNRIGVAALFGSVKCFKYLMITGATINKDTCMLAVAGGNNEIIHLCEQKRHRFEDCLIVSLMYHRFEIFEWLNTHFNYDEIQVTEFIKYYNEPLFILIFYQIQKHLMIS